LNYIQNGKTLKWVREESLSNIKQVEIMDQEIIRIESELEYVKNVKSPVSLHQIPTKILARYKENIQYLINSVIKLVKSN
jgi:hypothetical protein